MSSSIASQLAALPLRKTADGRIRKAIRSGNPADFQRAVAKDLEKVRRKLNKALDDCPLTSLWSADGLARTDDDRRLQAELRVAIAEGTDAAFEAACKSLSERLAVASGPPTVFEALVAAELMLRRPTSFCGAHFALVYFRLAATDFDEVSTASGADVPAPAETAMRLVAEGEACFLVSLLLDPLSCSKALRARATKCLAQCIEASTDTDGTLHAAISRNVRQWLTPFVRVAAWSKAFGEPWSKKPTLTRWNDCLERLAALTLADGFITDQMAPAESSIGPIVSGTTLLAKAVELTEFPAGAAVPSLMKSLTRKGDTRKSGKPSKTKTAANANRQSDWAAAAVFRNTFHADADIIFLDWEEEQPRLRLAALGTQVLNGAWESRITVDGQPQQVAGHWVCTCWFEDEEVAFAELEAGSPDGLRHVRQVLLGLKEHFAVITDTVTCPERDSEIDFESRLQLSPKFDAESHPITRDLLISDDCVSVRTIPAWLEDDRIHHACGSCRVVDGSLVLQAQNRGGVTVPLVLDWHPERKACEPDWNRLTVTEDRRINTTHEASGFRVRSGCLQLLLFRSLRRGETLRAVLGHHTSNETVYGHIRNSGQLAPLVMVESEA